MAAKITGKVKWFNVKKGYGFITVCLTCHDKNICFFESSLDAQRETGPRQQNWAWKCSMQCMKVLIAVSLLLRLPEDCLWWAKDRN
jgi:hypothetical protein